MKWVVFISAYKRCHLFSLAFVVVVFAFLKQARHSEFQSYSGAWHRVTNTFVEKHILISWFLAHSEVKVLEKVLMQMLVCSVQITSRLDSQSKFQMFTLFSGRNVGVPQKYTNMAAPHWALLICAKYFDEYLSQCLELIHWMVFEIFFLLRDSANEEFIEFI